MKKKLFGSEENTEICFSGFYFRFLLELQILSFSEQAPHVTGCDVTV